MRAIIHPWKGFDPLIYVIVRFVALETLYAHGELRYSELLKIMRSEISDLTEGNLAGHLSKLEDVGYVEANRYYEGKKGAVKYKITEKGKGSFEAYLIGTIGRFNLSLKSIGIKNPMKNKILS
jgi:DNA-binding transcriptional ArsR family regulator